MKRHALPLIALAAWYIGSGSAAAVAAPFMISYASVDAGVFSPSTPVSNLGETGASANLISNFGTSTFSGQALAQSSYGLMKNFAQVEITNYSPESFTSICGPNSLCGPGGGPVRQPAVGGNIQSDQFTITGGSGSGYLRITFSVSGETSLSTNVTTDPANWGPPIAQGTLTLYSGVYGIGASIVSAWGYTDDATFVSALIPFTYGVAFDLSLASTAFIDPADFLAGPNYDLSGTADFASTIALANMAIFNDPTGTTQVAATVSSASGTSYPTAFVSAVPEPGSLLAFVLGAALLGLGSRRQS